jgi:hypothetical protein
MEKDTALSKRTEETAVTSAPSILTRLKLLAYALALYVKPVTVTMKQR